MSGNPFLYGKPVGGQRPFTGRRDEVHVICEAIRARESVAITGERRVGKSSILLHLADPAVGEKNGLEAGKYIFVYVDLQLFPAATPTELWQHILSTAARFVDGEVQREGEKLARQDTLRPAELVPWLQVLERAGLTLVILFDEFDGAVTNPNFNAGFYSGLRGLSNYAVSFVVASHRTLSELRRQHPEILSSPFFNFFRHVTLTGFSEAEVDELLQRGLRGTAVTFSPGDCRFIRRTGGLHPYFVQLAAHYLFAAYAGNHLRDGKPDLRWVVEWMRSAGVEQFLYYWEASDNGEKLVLATLALIESGDMARYNLARVMDRQPGLGPVLRRLRQRVLLDELDGQLRVFSGLFSEWIAEQVAFIASDRVDDFEQLVRAAKVEGPWDRWIDATERLRRGFAWVDTRAIVQKVLVEKGPEAVLDLLSGIIVKILFPDDCATIRLPDYPTNLKGLYL